MQGMAPHFAGGIVLENNGGRRLAGRRRGFTLLEMCIVLLILGILMGVLSPGIQSALAESALRSDARELSLLVKTGMLRSNEEHRAYVLNLSETALTLGPAAPVPAPDGSTTPDSTDAKAPPPDPTDSWSLDAQNVLLLPDPKAHGKWEKIHSAEWMFRPGDLCPATDICFTRGAARLEVSFNSLTGNVEKERSVFP